MLVDCIGNSELDDIRQKNDNRSEKNIEWQKNKVEQPKRDVENERERRKCLWISSSIECDKPMESMNKEEHR